MNWDAVSRPARNLVSIGFATEYICDPTLQLTIHGGQNLATDPADGLGLCFASSERLLQTKAIVYLATHFKEMTKLTMYPNVEMWVSTYLSCIHFCSLVCTTARSCRAMLLLEPTLLRGATPLQQALESAPPASYTS